MDSNHEPSLSRSYEAQWPTGNAPEQQELPVYCEGNGFDDTEIGQPYSSWLNGEHLQVAQVNLKKCFERGRQLKAFLETSPARPDIIAIQDPPPHLPWIRVAGYHVWYDAPRELKWSDNPSIRQGQPVPIACVAFLVSTHISQSNWRVTRPGAKEDKICEFVASLTMTLCDGDELLIHNLYNRHESADLQELAVNCMSDERTILLGDFNISHPEGPRRAEHKPQELARFAKGALMRCLTPLEPTYSRGVERPDGKYSTTIDLVFASPDLVRPTMDNTPACRILNVPGFDTDHRVITTSFPVIPEPASGSFFQWRKINAAEYQAAMRVALESAQFPPLDTVEAIDKHTEKIFNTIFEVVKCNVKICDRFHRRAALKSDPDVLREVRREMELLKQHQAENSHDTERAWREAHEAVRKLQQDLRKRRYRDYAASEEHDIHSKMKQTSRWSAPQSLGIECLMVNGEEHRTPEAKSEVMKSVLFKETSDIDKTAPVHTVPGPSKESVAMNDLCLRTDELKKVIQALPARRSAQPDGVGNIAYKLAADEIIPHLDHLFTACLRLSYHPKHFKHANTILLRKPDKEDYTDPKSWRPIALLSCMGKILERIMTNRLTEVVKLQSLLPMEQFAGPGRCTTMALQSLLNNIYTTWTQPVKVNQKTGYHVVSFLSLDIAAAFDSVSPQRLLGVLLDLGVPRWQVRFHASFLSARTATINFDDYESPKWYKNWGVPAGSPIAGMLFMLFVVGLIKRVNNMPALQNGAKFVLAYVDDHGVAAASESYETNCRIFEEVNEVIMEWAGENGMAFNPSKYALMHLRRPGTHDGRPEMLKAHKAKISEWKRLDNLHKERSRKRKHAEVDTSPAPDELPELGPMPVLPPVSTALPSIDGLTEKALRTEKRFLGVIIDDELSWKAHVHHIIGKVHRILRFAKRLHTSTWGASLRDMRKLYLTSIRPVITYGCGAWFVRSLDHSLKWRLSNVLMKKLESLQYQCLKQLSGAFFGTSVAVLCKELAIEELEVCLDQQARRHRACLAASPDMADWERVREERGQQTHRHTPIDAHPFKHLHLEAKTLSQEVYINLQRAKDPGPRTKEELTTAIRKHLKKTAWAIAERRWKAYTSEHPKNDAAYKTKWDKSNWKLYKGLTRAQSSMLLHCRTGCIGLRHYRARLFQNKDTDVSLNRPLFLPPLFNGEC
jgi:hypothetical protein